MWFGKKNWTIGGQVIEKDIWSACELSFTCFVNEDNLFGRLL